MIMNHDISWKICDLLIFIDLWSLYFVVIHVNTRRSQVSTSVAASFLHHVDCVALHWQHLVPKCVRCASVAVASCQRETAIYNSVINGFYKHAYKHDYINMFYPLRVGLDINQMDGQGRLLAHPFWLFFLRWTSGSGLLRIKTDGWRIAWMSPRNMRKVPQCCGT